MNAKKAKKLRKMAEFDPNRKREYVRVILDKDGKKGPIQLKTGEEKTHYKDLKKLYKSGELDV